MREHLCILQTDGYLPENRATYHRPLNQEVSVFLFLADTSLSYFSITYDEEHL
jgi:hypothetical protein